MTLLQAYNHSQLQLCCVLNESVAIPSDHITYDDAAEQFKRIAMELATQNMQNAAALLEEERATVRPLTHGCYCSGDGMPHVCIDSLYP